MALLIARPFLSMTCGLSVHGVRRISMVHCQRHLSLSTKPVKPITIMEAQDMCADMVATPTGSRCYGLEDNKLVQGDNVLPFSTDQKKLPAKTMQDSYSEVVIPLGQDLTVRERYVSFWKGLRFGRMFEDLDTFAVLISYIHIRDPTRGKDQKSPLANVTALVDRIDLHENAYRVSPNHDIKMCGQVTWVGKSSMEITMQIEQDRDGHTLKLLTARFVMVARNPITGQAGVVNPLKLNGIEEQELFTLGEKNKLKRQEKTRMSLLKMAPSEEERIIIHRLFLETIDPEAGTFAIRVKPQNTVWMEDTKLKSIAICHPEERNIYGKIFGGFLMRSAFELAWSNASLCCKDMPVVSVIDDIVFEKPVEIGNLLLLASQIVYTEGNLLVVRVHAMVYDISTAVRHNTNQFYFTFSTSGPELPRVIPRSYSEAMLYLDGMRHVKYHKEK